MGRVGWVLINQGSILRRVKTKTQESKSKSNMIGSWAKWVDYVGQNKDSRGGTWYLLAYHSES